MDRIKQHALVVALHGGDLVTKLLSGNGHHLVYVGECRRAVNGWLTRAEQVQIGPIDEQESPRARMYAQRSAWLVIDQAADRVHDVLPGTP